jgi:arginyl-tRNA synthetase
MIREKLQKDIRLALKDIYEGKSGEDVEIRVLLPKPEFGDYATTVSFSLSKILKKNPNEIAIKIKDALSKSDFRVETKGGYINFFVKDELLRKKVYDIAMDRFAFPNSGNFRKVHIEYISANPTGPLNVVSGRAGAVGFALQNLLFTVSYYVYSEYYVNDYGNQVWLFGKSLYARYKGEEPPADGYKGDYVKDIADIIADRYASEIEKISEEEKLIDFFAKKGIELVLDMQKKDIEDYGIEYNHFFYESSLHREGVIDKVLDILRSKGVVYEKDKKLFFASSRYGDEKDRVIVRENGVPTYFLSDISYHYMKIERGFERIIDIFGPDHYGYIPRLRAAVNVLGFPDKDFITLIIQQVNLVRNGKRLDMSKRAGKFTTLRELMQEIPIYAIKYSFIRMALSSHLDFDIEIAKKMVPENPVFYVEYAYARICSIERKMKELGIDISPSLSSLSYLKEKEEILLMRKLIHFEEIVGDSANFFEPHLLCHYLEELSTLFHSFYEKYRVIEEDENIMKARYTLVEAVKNVIYKGLTILGIEALEKM